MPMKRKSRLCWFSAFVLSATLLQAQDPADIQKLNDRLRLMQENFEKQQRELRENFEKLVREQQAQIDALKRQIAAGSTNAAATIPTNAPAQKPPAQSPEAAPPASAKPAELSKPWSPANPITLLGGQRNYLNLSFDGLFAAGTSTADDIEQLEQGDHDPHQRGFTLQNLETVFEGKVDPYFRAIANIVMKIDTHGDTGIEAEEAFLETMSLPWNLQVKAGQFLTEFGRMNATHPHTWDFVDAPLVLNRFMGPDGLRNPGARVSWLTPTPFYSELFFAIQNSQGETAHSFRNDNGDAPFFGRPVTQGRVKNVDDMLFTARYAASFDLTDAQTILGGASAAFGPNGTGNGADTQIYGVDLFWKWKSPQQHAGFPFVTWQTEAMLRRFQADAFAGDAVIPALPDETLTDYGLYSQVAYGFRKGWVAAFRGDYVFPDKRGAYEALAGPDPDRATRWRLSPNLTYYPSEFSKIRLQYNYDDRNGAGDDHSVWLQFEFLLGSHAAHKF